MKWITLIERITPYCAFVNIILGIGIIYNGWVIRGGVIAFIGLGYFIIKKGKANENNLHR